MQICINFPFWSCKQSCRKNPFFCEKNHNVCKLSKCTGKRHEKEENTSTSRLQYLSLQTPLHNKLPRISPEFLSILTVKHCRVPRGVRTSTMTIDTIPVPARDCHTRYVHCCFETTNIRYGGSRSNSSLTCTMGTWSSSITGVALWSQRAKSFILHSQSIFWTAYRDSASWWCRRIRDSWKNKKTWLFKQS